MRPPLQIHLFPKGPSLKALVHINETGIDSVILKYSSDGFSCEIDAPSNDAVAADVVKWFTAFSQKQRLPLPKMDKKILTPFQDKVLSCMAEISFGETASYGELAEKAGCPKGGRAVGNVCRANPFPLFFPCHRIIHKSGSIGGFAYNILMKKDLLAFEGLII
jgi:methylated-DNA-[protein]-cysteine S-methyltransferase